MLIHVIVLFPWILFFIFSCLHLFSLGISMQNNDMMMGTMLLDL